MDITNKTRKPLSLPLPGGKKLFLGPGKSGQVNQRALEFKPLAKLIEAGDVEVTGDGSKVARAGGNTDGPSAAPQFQGTGAIRQSGDR